MNSKKSLVTLTRSILVILGLFALFVTATFTTSSEASAHSTWDKGNAYVRVLHAAPGAGVVDVFVDGGKLLSNFKFGTVTGYVKVAAGSHKIQVAPAGKGASKSVINVTVSLSKNTYYTAAALGTKSFSLKAFVDNNSDVNTQARIRVYHLSPNAGPVDVSVGKTKVISKLTYENASGYLTVAPGTSTFNVTAINAGVTIPLKATLKKDLVYSVFAIGLYKGSPALQFAVAAVDVD